MSTSRRALDPFAMPEELESYTNKTLNKSELQLLVKNPNVCISSFWVPRALQRQNQLFQTLKKIFINLF